jgi:endonuclease III
MLKVNQILLRLQELNPSPKTELIYHSSFELLVAVILSAQTTDKQVNIVTKRLFAKANTAAAILKLGQIALTQEIRSIGLFNTKAANIIKTSEILQNQYQGNIPQKREALEALPGVGRKTANVVLNTLFKEKVIGVDTHVMRVSERTGIATGKNPLAIEKTLMATIHPSLLEHAHHWLVLHGRYVCKAKNPGCNNCDLRDLCDYTKNIRKL